MMRAYFDSDILIWHLRGHEITGGKLYTLNVKHYPMEDIIIEKPW
ncbi:MAG: hypothetical protein PVH61_30235 [Candidatus Aminicenantes bacterium]|jgi:hypothetical protein